MEARIGPQSPFTFTSICSKRSLVTRLEVNCAPTAYRINMRLLSFHDPPLSAIVQLRAKCLQDFPSAYARISTESNLQVRQGLWFLLHFRTSPTTNDTNEPTSEQIFIKPNEVSVLSLVALLTRHPSDSYFWTKEIATGVIVQPLLQRREERSTTKRKEATTRDIGKQ